MGVVNEGTRYCPVIEGTRWVLYESTLVSTHSLTPELRRPPETLRKVTQHKHHPRVRGKGAIRQH